MRFQIGQAVHMSGPFSVSGGGGSVQMGAGASVLGQIAKVNANGTYDIQLSGAIAGVSYIPGVPASRLTAA